MDKPFSMRLRETREQLMSTINASGLPIDVIDLMLGELKNVAHLQAENAYQMELKKMKDTEVEE